MKKFACVIFSLIFALCLCGCSPVKSQVKSVKVILFIGDGMGFNHVANTELYYGEQTYFSSFKTKLKVQTDSLDSSDGKTPTDSAAAATALATGVKVYNQSVSMLNGENLTSITELAKRKGIGAGVVTSDTLYGATPSAFTAHATNRNKTDKIIESQLNSPVDLLLGSGSYYLSKTYAKKFKRKGFSLYNTLSSTNVNKSKVLGGYSSVIPENATDERPTLTQLTVKAIEYMELHYPNGYFLMIEGAYIDKQSHNNKLLEAMQNVRDFSSAIKTAESMVTGEYSIIVTADHETGGLQLAQTKSEISNELYTTTEHTTANVPLYYSSSLADIPGELLVENGVIDNTDVFYLCKNLLVV